MMIKATLTVAALMLTAGSCFGGTITSIDVTLGTWDASTFTSVGSIWNTFDGGNWAVGATTPGYGNPLLNSFANVALADGEYWLYMAQYDGSANNAIRITLGYLGGGSNVEVFTAVEGSPEFVGGYTLVSGSGFSADLVAAPQTDHELVGTRQVYSSDGTPNWIVDINSNAPEPGSWVLMGTGFAALIFAARRRRKGVTA
jgi:hypothetical protein